MDYSPTSIPELNSRVYFSAVVSHIFCSSPIFPVMLPNQHSITRQTWREWTFFVLNSFSVYRSVVFANKVNQYENIFTATEARFLPNAPTQNRPPDSRLPPNADSTRPHRRSYHSLVCISCYQSRHRQNLITAFPTLHERRTRAVKRDGHWLLY
jgi:hypothetical protein